MILNAKLAAKILKYVIRVPMEKIEIWANLAYVKKDIMIMKERLLIVINVLNFVKNGKYINLINYLYTLNIILF